MASILIRAEGTSPTAIPLENSTDCGKQSVLIKDTTREQREQIVCESLGEDYDVGCGYESTGINYQLYIDGVKELRELNMEANCGFEVAHPEERKSGCNMI